MVRNIGFEPMIGESESHALPLGQFRENIKIKTEYFKYSVFIIWIIILPSR